MLKTILEMDKQAQKKLEEAEAYRRDTIAGLVSKKAEVVNDETQKARESAQRRSDRRKTEGEKSLADVKARNKKVLENMNRLYESNADKWVDEIVNNVIKF